jgi:multidrug resistance efflux pump
MHPNLRRILPIILILVASAALAYWYFVVHPAQADEDDLTASGTIVITQVQIGAEIGGKVVEVSVEEGEAVKTGDTLVQIDTALLKAQRLQSEAALELAKANAEAAQYTVDAAQASVEAASHNLALLKAGASEDQLAASLAQLAQAEANLQAAQASLAALTAGARPEDVSAARQVLAQARSAYYTLVMTLTSEQVDALQAASSTARSNLEDAQSHQDSQKKSADVPAVALEAAAQAVSDAAASSAAAQAALGAAQDAGLPFYRQVEAAQLSWNITALGLSQASTRQQALIDMGEMPAEALQAAQDEVDAAQELVDEAQGAFNELIKSPQGDRLRAAWRNVQAVLVELNTLGSTPTTPLETLLNQLDASAATRDLAQANLSLTQSGTRDEQIKAAEAQVSAAQAQLDAAQALQRAAQAQVKAAQAALDTLDVQIGKLTIVSPVDGVVLTRVIQPGEIALTSATLLVLGLEEDKTITVYVPEERYGEISVGQEAFVNVDSFLGVNFKARVIHISDKAEFTPRNVQTVEGRKNTVFAIRLQIVDGDERLKAGMPADVRFK